MFCSDSLTLIEAINGSSQASSQIKSTVKEIRSYLQYFEYSDCVWIARESNHLPDQLARLGRIGSTSGPCSFDGEKLSFLVSETQGHSMKC